MPEHGSQFVELEQLLNQAGIVPDSAQRLTEELRDHYEDRYAEAVDAGLRTEQAAAIAWQSLGSPDDIAAVAAQYRELMSVSHRHPLLAGLIQGLAHGVANSVLCVVASPALPVIYCAQRRESIARWSVSAGLAAMLTAGMLLSMQTILGVI